MRKNQDSDRDGKKIGSGINIKRAGSATLGIFSKIYPQFLSISNLLANLYMEMNFEHTV
jgi:hypothetical protein